MKLFSKAYWLYLLFCAIVFCASLELFVRFRTQRAYGFQHGSISEMYKTDEKTGLRIPKPNLEIKGSKTYIKINSLGFRGSEMETVKSPNTIRIAAVGASTTFCAEVSDNDSVWIELVRAKLNQQFPSYHFEAINGGVPGYGIDSSLKNLRKRITVLEPDLVIFYEATNEISNESRRAAIAKGIIKEAQNHYGFAFASFLSRHSQAFDLLYKNIAIAMRQKQSPSGQKLNKFPVEYVIPFIAYLDSIRLECEKINAPMIMFTFSTKFRREQTPEQQLANMNTALYYMPWMAPDTFFEAFDLFNGRMFEFAQQHKNVYIDTLQNQIPGDNQHFVDSVHFTDRGCRMMAARVFSALIREGLIQEIIERRQLQ